MRIGMIVRSDHTGLGNQTRNLCYMLKPSKVLVINSTGFTKGNKQNNTWYEGFNAFVTRQSFPTNGEVHSFLKNIDVLISCEMFYNPMFITEARKRGIKTVLQYNYEFFDNLNNKTFPWPDVLIAPSMWHFAEINAKVNQINKSTGSNIAHVQLPPPVYFQQFSVARSDNLNRSNKILHVAGKRAVHDRNGTYTLIEALKYTDKKFELVIKSQDGMDAWADTQPIDYRVRFDFTSPKDEADLYKGFDFMVLPRKYGGLCLPMNEALCSGIPVIMTDVEPNHYLLPDDWLVKTRFEGSFMARTVINIDGAYPEDLARSIDRMLELEDGELSKLKSDAAEIGFDNFSYDNLRSKYEEVLNSV